MLGWTLPISAVVSMAVLAATPQDSEPKDKSSEARVLDEITTTGREFNIGPQTGEFIFRPVLYTIGANGSPARQIDFFFSPVIETSSGLAVLYNEQERQRYRVSVVVPIINPTGTRLKQTRGSKIDLGTHRLNLPGGTYVLSEIRYGFVESFSGRRTFRTTRTTRSFCLSPETYAFDIQNGKSQFLGGLALAPFPTNISRLRSHHPVRGVDNRLELVSGPASRNIENVEPLEFDLLAFEAQEGLCGNRQYEVAALAP